MEGVAPTTGGDGMKHLWWSVVERIAWELSGTCSRLHLWYVFESERSTPRIVSWAQYQTCAFWTYTLRKWRQSKVF